MYLPHDMYQRSAFVYTLLSFRLHATRLNSDELSDYRCLKDSAPWSFFSVELDGTYWESFYEFGCFVKLIMQGTEIKIEV